MSEHNIEDSLRELADATNIPPEIRARMDADRAQAEAVTSEAVRPVLPSYGDHWERGVDPWHVDAFKGGLEHVGAQIGATGERKRGWDLIDYCGNLIGFVPDGTPVGETIKHEIKIVEVRDGE